MKRSLVSFALVALPFGVVACATHQDAARAEFVKETSCNEPLVITTHAGDVPPPSSPPPELKDDPGQLAIWKRDDEERRQKMAATVYVVKGCGQEKHLVCEQDPHHATATVCQPAIEGTVTSAPPDADVKKCTVATTKPEDPAAQRSGADAKHCKLGDSGGCESACNAHDAESCALLGKMYGEGIDVELSYDKSNQYLTLACGAGSARACHGLGVVHDFGHGMQVDPKGAIPFYEQACTWGYADSCANLAGHYANGNGVAADPAKVVAFSKKACAWGSAAGCKRLGALDLGGIGTTKDADCANVAFRKACSLGDADACKLAKAD
ncbi:MAG TPA: tetratricopeptide repeat protein [Polyangiaceae bacterium]